ncbi:DUF6185 family protein [Saccharothrix sp. NRRL B-16348]|uniref:DUF6185 family protein n=1 Tax=Saccharothrix sp. NRRL B-16348 TaxID=1415542 RepID=UPI0012FC602D
MGEGVKVGIRIRITVENVLYPRIVTEQSVQVPVATPGSELLLLNEDDPRRQSAFECLFHASRWPAEVRDAPPQVIRSTSTIEVTDRVHVDVFSPGTSWAGTTAVQVDAAGWWNLSVIPTPGLAATPWDVDISAPDGWLSSPTPWQSVEMERGRMHWNGVVPNTIGEQLSVRVDPGLATALTLKATAPSWKPWTLTLAAVSILSFAGAMSLFLGLRRKQFEPAARRLARRATWAPIILTTTIGGLSVCVAVLERYNTSTQSTTPWWYIDWYLNIGFTILLALVAVMWWLPRCFVALMTTAMLGTSWLIFLTAGGTGGLNDITSTATGVLDAVLAFASTLILTMAAGKAVHVLLGNGEPRTAPRWLWITAPVVSAVLVVERYLIAHLNSASQEWLGVRHAVNLTAVYRVYPWELLAESQWLLLGLSALALWHFVKKSWFEPAGSPARTAAVILLAVGPLWWQLELLGWSVPFGLLVLLGILGAIPLFEKLWPSVLHRSGVGSDLDLARIRAKARRWYRKRTYRTPLSPIDVLLAAGPVGTPSGNMATAMRLALMPALLVGGILTTTGWAATPLLSTNQEDSILLLMASDVVWETAKWILGAAALGLAWQHLPGRRGVVKILPGVAVYSLLPLVMFAVDTLLHDVHNWFFVAEVSTFTLIGFYVALRMDKMSLNAAQASDLPGGRLRRMLNAYGLENFSTSVTTLLTPAIAVLAVWSAVQGGDVTYPNVNPMQAPHAGAVQTAGR